MCVCVQTAEGIVEGYVAALEQALAAALDPRKLTPVGVGAAPGGSSVGATGRSATAAASTAKLQVRAFPLLSVRLLLLLSVCCSIMQLSAMTA